MKYRTLGKTGMVVSVVGMGTWQLGGEWGKDFSQDEVDGMFDAAREVGINLIDTAECYGDHASERLIGAAVEGGRDRERWIIATKFGHVFHGFMNRTDERAPADAVRQVEASLKALRTDYVDLLQYHSVSDADFDNEALHDTLVKLVKSGKVRHLGNSIGSNDNLHQTERSPWAGVEAIQLIYNRLDRKPEQRVLPACERMNLGVLARVPLASGFLSGKYSPGAQFKSGDVRAGRDQARTDEQLREVQRITREEVPADVSIASWALAWCLRNPAVTCVIPGCKSAEQVRANAAAADPDLVRDDHPQAATPPAGD